MEPPARAADRARIQAPFLYRGCGPAVVAGSVQAPHPGTRGDGVNAGCGTRVFRSTVAVDAVVPDDAAERIAVAGHGFVSVSLTGYQLREVTH
jgi:hypothetical protein